MNTREFDKIFQSDLIDIESFDIIFDGEEDGKLIDCIDRNSLIPEMYEESYHFDGNDHGYDPDEENPYYYDKREEDDERFDNDYHDDDDYNDDTDYGDYTECGGGRCRTKDLEEELFGYYDYQGYPPRQAISEDDPEYQDYSGSEGYYSEDDEWNESYYYDDIDDIFNEGVFTKAKNTLARAYYNLVLSNKGSKASSTGDWESMHEPFLRLIANSNEKTLKVLKDGYPNLIKTLDINIKYVRAVEQGKRLDNKNQEAYIRKAISKGQSSKKIEAHKKWCQTEIPKAIKAREKELIENESYYYDDIESIFESEIDTPEDSVDIDRTMLHDDEAYAADLRDISYADDDVDENKIVGDEFPVGEMTTSDFENYIMNEKFHLKRSERTGLLKDCTLLPRFKEYPELSNYYSDIKEIDDFLEECKQPVIGVQFMRRYMRVCNIIVDVSSALTIPLILITPLLSIGCYIAIRVCSLLNRKLEREQAKNSGKLMIRKLQIIKGKNPKLAKQCDKYIEKLDNKILSLYESTTKDLDAVFEEYGPFSNTYNTLNDDDIYPDSEGAFDDGDDIDALAESLSLLF